MLKDAVNGHGGVMGARALTAVEAGTSAFGKSSTSSGDKCTVTLCV